MAAEPMHHLIVVSHGLWGTASHVSFLGTRLKEHFGESAVVLLPRGNEWKQSMDGIDVCGERIANEVIAELKRFPTLKKFSIIGFSLGGLWSRYAVGVLYEKGILPSRLEPTNFITLASPHLGSRRTPRTAWNRVWNWGAETMFGNAGRQLVLEERYPSDTKDPPRPLLLVMCDPDSPFLKGLASFKRRTVYANTVNDHTVPYCTASLSSTNPYNHFPGGVWGVKGVSDRYFHVAAVIDTKAQEPSAPSESDTCDMDDDLGIDDDPLSPQPPPPLRNDDQSPSVDDSSSNPITDQSSSSDDPSSHVPPPLVDDDVPTSEAVYLRRNTPPPSPPHLSGVSPLSSSGADSSPAAVGGKSPSVSYHWSAVLWWAMDVRRVLKSVVATAEGLGLVTAAHRLLYGKPADAVETIDQFATVAAKGEAEFESSHGVLCPPEEDIGPFQRDERRHQLRDMFSNLHLLSWRRVDCRLPGPQSHGHIVVRNAWRNQYGADVVDHLVRETEW
mmetsp:Transcript_13281/g.21795  ORF Transcript_13281/g.21795 Transcript_13281/m.21795 type:complete len:501 (-) Transcript_13281:324-1826(-)